jgi:hypothetical protein
MPTLLTCILAKKIAGASVRLTSAKLVKHIVEKYASAYTTLSSRCMKTLCRGVIAGKSLASRYGGVIGLSMLGHVSFFY